MAELISGTLACATDVFLPLSVPARAGRPALAERLIQGGYPAASHVLASTRRRGGGPEDAALARRGAALRGGWRRLSSKR